MKPRGSLLKSSNSGGHLHWAPGCPDGPDSGSRGMGRGCPGLHLTVQVCSHQVPLQPLLSPGIPFSPRRETHTHTYHHHHHYPPPPNPQLSPEILPPECQIQPLLSTPQPSFSSGYHHLLSTKSLADFPDSGLVWMFCTTGSRKPRLGCLAVRKQWAESSEGQAWALWVTLGGS